MKFSRRLFLQFTFWLSGLLTVGGVFKYLAYKPESPNISTVKLAPANAYPMGSATYLTQARAWLYRDVQGVYAISIICPHLGCSVERHPEDFLCPCHGSRFTAQGTVINGPAAKNLNYLKLSLAPDGVLHLDLTQTVSANERLAVPNL